MRKTKKLVYGVGINDADYPVTKLETIYVEGREKKQSVCPYYSRWINMLVRCYCDKHKEKEVYVDVSVCKEWLTFSNFKAWMEQQDWEGKQLDKDILFPGNKVYSPEACCFVSSQSNSFLCESTKIRGEFPIGVSWAKHAKKFIAGCRGWDSSTKTLGYFDTLEEAFYAWLRKKQELSYVVASNEPDLRVRDAIIERYMSYPIPDFSTYPTQEEMINRAVKERYEREGS